MKKKVLILLLVIVIVGYTGYCALAQYEFSQGQAALKANDWLSAAIHFERVEGYTFAVPSRSSEILQLKDQSSLLVFGQSMREKGNYKEALDAYETFVYKFPEAETVSLVKDYFPRSLPGLGEKLA